MTSWYKYYKGNHPIKNRNEGNKVVVNYPYNITQTYGGYITGIPILYSSDSNIDSLLEVLNYNDVNLEDSELLRLALIMGKSYEICYIDEQGKQRFRVLDPRECIPVYDNTLNQELLYVIRFYKVDIGASNDDEYWVEVYDSQRVRKYKSTMGFSSFQLYEEYPHFFNQVPITVFSLNPEEESIFAQITSLTDAYNELVSDEVDSVQAWADAYLILKGVMADLDSLEEAKENRVFMMDSDASAEYLTKNISDAQIENLLSNLDTQIYKIANAPNFADDKFMSVSGESLKYKLVGFENVASGIESNMRKALQRRVELIAEILNMKGDELWRDIEIIFTRNLPNSITETATVINQLRGLVSDETLLSLLPFIKDAASEFEKAKEEKMNNLNMYSFTTGNEDEVNE